MVGNKYYTVSGSADHTQADYVKVIDNGAEVVKVVPDADDTWAAIIELTDGVNAIQAAACNDAGCSTPTDNVTVTYSESLLDTEPQDVDAVWNSDTNEVGIAWTPVDSADSYNIRRYIEYAGSLDKTMNTLDRSYKDSDVSKGHVYYYRVSAVIGDCSTPYSDPPTRVVTDGLTIPTAYASGSAYSIVFCGA